MKLLLFSSICPVLTLVIYNVCGGRSLAQVSLAYEKEHSVWLLSAPDKKPRELTSGQQPTLRPDGGAVAFLRYDPPNSPRDVPGKLVVRDLKTDAERELVTETFGDGPQWSPDGKKLAYLHYVKATGGHKICVIPADGGTKAETLNVAEKTTLGSIWSLEWLPDGAGFGFHDMEYYWKIDLNGQVRKKCPLASFAGKKNPDGKARMALSSADTIAQCPADATLLAYTEDVDGSEKFAKALHGEPISALLLVNVNPEDPTPQPRLITDKTVTVADVVWAPDGKTLYFTGYRDTHARDAFPFRIYRIGAGGENLVEIDRGTNPSVASNNK